MSIKPVLSLIFACCIGILGCGSGGGGGSDSGDSSSGDNGKVSAPGDMLLGAHYYMWFPAAFNGGFLRHFLVPAQEPLLGLYNSNDARAVEQHIEWAAAAGIN